VRLASPRTLDRYRRAARHLKERLLCGETGVSITLDRDDLMDAIAAMNALGSCTGAREDLTMLGKAIVERLITNLERVTHERSDH
jgi:hypothetical protein